MSTQLNRRGFISLLSAMPCVAVIAQSGDKQSIEKAAEKSYESIIEWLRSDEWTMGNGQCHECYGMAPDGTPRKYGGVTSWGDWQRPTGHAPNCKLAMSLELLGSPVAWSTETKPPC